MSNYSRRLLALLIAVVMVIGLLPAAVFAETPREADADKPIHVFTEEENAILDNDVFAKIETVKVEAAQTCGGIHHMTEADYVAAIPQVIAAVEASETYVPGTLQRNGDFLVWETTVGIPCCYDPRMEAELHNTDNDPTPAEIAAAEEQAKAILDSVTEVRGGGPYIPDIGLIQPYWESSTSYDDGSFNNYSPQYKAMWQALYETTGGSGMRYSRSNATVDNIGATMSQCGLVMFDSHGTTDYSSGGDYTSRANSSYLCLTTATGITSQDTQAKSGPYGTYYDCIRSGNAAYVNGTCIANHMPNNAPNSYLYMGICLGMATDKMEDGLRNKGVEVVYGYSQSVTFAGDMDYMNTLNTAIKNGDDMATAVANMKTAVGVPDPYTSSRPAWPIVASSEDPYPGHGNVDQAQTVYSTWSLFGTNYEVTASSNNEEWGTVEVRGSQIVAHPAVGYYTAGYELLSGTATITQNGNTFLAQAESDCSVRIDFAAKTPAVVSYYSNNVFVSSENSYVGDDVVLPATAPEIEGYRFRGWVEAPVSETTEKPAFLKAGTSYTVTAPAVSIYALYSCTIGGGGLAYVLLTEAPDDWEGNYVISGGSVSSPVKVMKALPSGASYESNYTSSVIPYADAGMDLDEDSLREVGDDYLWHVEANGSYYTIQNVANETYLGLSGYSLYSLAGVSGNNTAWSFDYIENVGTRAGNVASGSYPYMVFYNNQKFALYGESSFTQYPVQFWKETEDGETYYYTEITSHEHTLEYVAANEPNCTETGNIAHWRCTICHRCFSDENGENEIPAASVVIAALGHSFGEWTETTAPGCTTAGEETRECSRCHTTETRPVDALGHNYVAVVTDPTCTEAGYTTHTCERCQDSYTDSETAALGHEFGEWTESTAPTCTAEGEETRTCTRCQETETRTVEALGHEWDEGVVTAKPTDSKDGEKLYTCARCQETKTEVLPKLNRDNPFVDVALSDWFYDQVLWAYYHDAQITSGLDENHFGPQNGCTRAQVATFLYAAAGKPTFEMPDASFSDVKETDWYYTPVMWALSKGITAGMGDGSFGANVTCTRAQIVTFLYAAADKPAFEMPDATFSDVTENDWFYTPVMWALSKGVTAGMGDGSFGATNTCTRSQVVTFLYKAYGENE